MTDRIFVGARKGLFTFERDGDDWTQARAAFLGSPVSMVLRDPRDGAIYVALNHGHFGVKLHRSDDSGETWIELPVPTYPVLESESATSLVQIWSLEGGGDDQPGVLWAGTLPGGLFRSSNRGESWDLMNSLWDRPERRRWMGGGYDVPGIHSICIDPRDSHHITVGVSCGGVWATFDNGQTWELRATGMFADYMPPPLEHDPNIQDPHRLVNCPAFPDVFWVQHHNGIFVSTDAAKSWQSISSAGPSTFGFAVAVHPTQPGTAWFAPAIKDEMRIPANGKLVVTRTRDGGQSFEVLHKGLPQINAYHLVYRHCLDIDHTGNRLAMASTTGSLWISHDQGDSWKRIASDLPQIYCLKS